MRLGPFPIRRALLPHWQRRSRRARRCLPARRRLARRRRRKKRDRHGFDPRRVRRRVPPRTGAQCCRALLHARRHRRRLCAWHSRRQRRSLQSTARRRLSLRSQRRSLQSRARQRPPGQRRSLQCTARQLLSLRSQRRSQRSTARLPPQGGAQCCKTVLHGCSQTQRSSLRPRRWDCRRQRRAMQTRRGCSCR
jgi:hypothetical protein